MTFTSDDLGKILTFLEKEKKKILTVEGILRFLTYPYGGERSDKQWIIINLKELKKQVEIKFYVSTKQVRFVLNGVELKDELINPFKTRIEKLNAAFKKEWERRELENIRGQFH